MLHYRHAVIQLMITQALFLNCFEDPLGNKNTIIVDNPLTNPLDGPPAGNPAGNFPVPQEGGLEEVTSPDHIIGTGTPESCTAEDFIKAVAGGGVITFNTGGKPVTITLPKTAKVFNDSSENVVIDGGGLVTLSGGGKVRILYMNTCDKNQHWITARCDNQETPRLTVQNITFVDGYADANSDEEGGGGAIFAQGGQFKAVNCRFFNNVCEKTGPDVGGGALRVFMQYQERPVYLVNCTFGGAEGYGNSGSNGGGISSIGVSWSIYNCLFSWNTATGNGGNPQESGTPGGGSGGAIYNDGNKMTLAIYGTMIEKNRVNAYGSGIFFVTNNKTGDIHIENSTVRNNTGGGWNTLPGVSMHQETKRVIINSEIIN
ncbi:MAG TPA: hypothetical protein VHO70_07430 [Chitinispirillaceae bacterium]|nr:hypothetical protein [Chitinispirillaceae bacterium]